jgi:hypothetical protein
MYTNSDCPLEYSAQAQMKAAQFLIIAGVYFRILLKRGKHIVANFKRRQIHGQPKGRGSNPILHNIGKANFQGGAKAPPDCVGHTRHCRPTAAARSHH